MHKTSSQCQVGRFEKDPQWSPSLVRCSDLNINNNSKHSQSNGYVTSSVLFALSILINLLVVPTLLVSYYYQLWFEVRKLRLREVKYPT